MPVSYLVRMLALPHHSSHQRVRLPADTVPWRPARRRDQSTGHPDLKAARTLTGILNKMTDKNAARMWTLLRGLSVKTEYGLYLLVETVCRRAIAEPREVTRCADVCVALADMQVAFLLMIV